MSIDYKQIAHNLTRKCESQKVIIKELQKGLIDLINRAEECDSWETFPSKDLNKAYEVLSKYQNQ